MITRVMPRQKSDYAHARLPISGTVLTRKYRGRQIEVKVLPDGSFEHDGAPYRSLSANRVLSEQLQVAPRQTPLMSPVRS